MNVAPSLNEEADITQVPENAAFTLGPHASMTVSRFDWQTGGGRRCGVLIAVVRSDFRGECLPMTFSPLQVVVVAVMPLSDGGHIVACTQSVSTRS